LPVTSFLLRNVNRRAHSHGIGRLLTPEDNQTRNAHPVAVLQYDFWRNHYSGSAAIVGTTIRLNGQPLTVVGVCAPGFEGTDVGLPTQVWVPVMMGPTLFPAWDELDDERSSWFYLFGRLKPGITGDQAQASMRVLYRQRQQEELNDVFFQKFPEMRSSFCGRILRWFPPRKVNPRCVGVSNVH
jgi:hypothetical protein